MVERQPAVGWFPTVVEGAPRRPRPAIAAGLSFPVPRLRRSRTASVVDEMAWGWLDVGRCVLWTVGLAAGGAVGFVVLRVLITLAFALGEGRGILPTGTYERLSGALDPYATALTVFVLGGLLYGAALYGVYRCAVRAHGLSWSALYIRPVRRRTYLRVAALFAPLTLAGTAITRLDARFLGRYAHDGAGQSFLHGMAPLPLNVALLGVLLVVMVPIAEELFFRAFLYRLLRARLPVWAAASGSALAFAALHGSPVLAPYLFFTGVVFALVVERTGSIQCAILLHAMVNALALFGMVVVLSGW